MTEVFYWKGQTGSVAWTNVNTVRTSATRGDQHFISAANNWNNPDNWMFNHAGWTGDDDGHTGDVDASYFTTAHRWPVAGDVVRLEQKYGFLDGSTSGITMPFTELLYGGTTNDYRWFGGTAGDGVSSAAGPLAALYILNSYQLQLIAGGVRRCDDCSPVSTGSVSYTHLTLPTNREV